VKVLLGRYARKLAIERTLVTLKKSIKYELPEISSELCRIFRGHYATQSKNELAYKKYAELALFFQKNTDAEDLAVKRYEHTSILLRKSGNSKLVIELCAKYCEELKPVVSEFKTFRLHLWYYFMAIRGALINAFTNTQAKF
jgi:hypothetical protein